MREVQNGMTVEPNQVYVIPPNTKMSLSEGVLQLSPREKVFGKYMPGDAFFASLAVDRGQKAIAVVLSGSDGDGSLGLKAIKAADGVTFAQCEDTASDSKRHRAELRAKVDHMGIKALHREAFAVRLKTGLIWLISCRPEQRCHESIGVVGVENGQNRLCTTAC